MKPLKEIEKLTHITIESAGNKLQIVANIQGYPSYDFVPVWINFDGKFQEKK